MIERVQFGVRVGDRITSTHRSRGMAKAMIDVAGVDGEVVVRTVAFGSWGPLPPRCPVHFLTFCEECGWTWRT